MKKIDVSSMKVVILAGGFGTRISEESVSRPKPMILLDDKPILWHLMKYYAAHGFVEFVICGGYKFTEIAEYFLNYQRNLKSFTLDIGSNSLAIHEAHEESWRVTVVDTGLSTMTGGRLKRVLPYIQGDEAFCFTYGDGLSDINIDELINFHFNHGKLATMSAVYPPARFGALSIEDDNKITSFEEKPRGDGGRINGGFFVLSPKVVDFIDGDTTVWEKFPLEHLASNGELMAFKHSGFWQPMDTLKDKRDLQEMIKTKKAPWMIW